MKRPPNNADQPVRLQPEGLSGLDLAAYLVGDSRLRTRCKLAFLRALHSAATDLARPDVARIATDLLRGTNTFDQAFATHWYPLLLAGGVDHHTGEDELAAGCGDLITALADVPAGGEPSGG